MTRSASVIASARSCVTKTTVCRCPVQSARSCAWRRSLVWVSRAPNGSSIRRISGSTTSVRISATRWRIPPDRVAGKASSNPSSPASRMASRTRRSRSAPRDAPVREAELDVLGDGAPGEDGVLLEDVADLPRGTPVNGRPSSRMAPAVGATRPAIMLSTVDLPQPDGPDEGDELLVADVERHARRRRRMARPPAANVLPRSRISIADARRRGQDRCDAFRTKDMSTAFWKGMGAVEHLRREEDLLDLARTASRPPGSPSRRCPCSSGWT